MRLSARFSVIFVLQFLLSALAFAGDTAKPAANPQETVASESAASAAAAPLNGTQPATPIAASWTRPFAAPSSSKSGENTPKGELFVGYSYLLFNVDAPLSTNGFNSHGVIGSIAGNVNRWFALEGDVSAHRVNGLPPGASATASTFLFGPRFSKRGERWTPFMHALFGGAHLHEDKNAGLFGPNAQPVSTNSFAMAFGAGLDLTLSKHFAARIFQGEYLISKFTDGGDSQQNNLRASAGLVLRFGGNPPPPPPLNHPPVATCSANPSKITAGSGDSIVVQAKASDPDNDPLTYAWSATGGSVAGTGPEVRWNAGNAAPGAYTVTARVDDGRGGNASCSADVQVEPRPNRPPTITCAANPATVEVGQQSNIAATASDPDNDPLTYTYTTSGGRITGSGANVQLDTTGGAPGTYTVACSVDDGRGGTASASTTINVRPIPKNLLLHSIYFQTARPTVKDPAGGLLPSQEKTLITLASDFKEYLTYKSDARLKLQGYADPRGGPKYNLALSDRRVERTKSFLVGQGVPADKLDAQGMGEEPPPDKASEARIKDAVEREQDLTPAQKKVLTRSSLALALAQSRRVDVTLEGTSDTSSRQYPFAAGDALNLIDPRGIATRREEQRQKKAKAPAPRPRRTTKGPAAKKPAAKKK